MEKFVVKRKGNYRDLICYRKAEAIYDITYFFANKFFRPSDRTIDQMIQAARSGKQNIIEGYAASVTSVETEIKLLNVAKSCWLITRIICVLAIWSNGIESQKNSNPRND